MSTICVVDASNFKVVLGLVYGLNFLKKIYLRNFGHYSDKNSINSLNISLAQTIKSMIY